MTTRENLEGMLAAGQDGALLRFSLGELCLREADAGQAVRHLGEALRLKPDYSAAWKLYGRALEQAGRQADAVAAYEQGIRVADQKGDLQAAKEMQVFLRRLRRPRNQD
jgi:Flp pilus assembly protein TadD